ncbi:uncharacterized protein LOC115547181 [Gadus morhua]|uniref:uncharacterized protein LOC115547181 n=1 Tax=Gadus morhua TaxID=8049 RepID=UPI0011B611D7|nr:uncharacterized protein LOC115547181 [Gadus morhua]
MGRRATDLATPVPVLGVPALVGLRGYKTAGPPPLPSLSWTQQCSIGVQTSPGVGKLPLLHPCARQPVNIVFTPSGNYGTHALESFVAKELKEEGVLQPAQSDRLQGLASKQRCVEAKTRKEVTFQEVPAGTSEHREGSQANNKTDCCYARAIKTNPHLAGSLPRGGPKPKLNLRYTNGSVVDSAAIGGISVEGADARPVKDGAALCRDQVHPGGGHCGEQAGEGASATAVQPFRTPPKICNQCGGKQALLPCGPDIMEWQKATGSCPEGKPLNPGTIPSPSTATATNTTTATDMGKLRDLQVGHSQQPPGRTPCLAGRLPPLSPNVPHPSCPMHSVPAIPQCHSVAPLPPQTPTQIPAALHTKALTVTEAVIETRQHNATGDSLEIQPHANKPSLPACLSSPPQFAIATKSNIPYGCSYRKRTETSNCITARNNVADDGAAHIAPSHTKLPAAVLESTRSNTPTPPGPENTSNTIKSTSTNTLHTDFKIHMYTVGLKGPNTVNDSITVKNKNMKNKESPDSSRSTKPMNSAKLPKASLEMVMNTKNNAKTAMRPQTFPGSILHLSTTQVMDTLSSYKQNNTAFPGGTHVHIQTPTHTVSHTTTIAKTTTDLVAATNPFKRVGTPLEANPSDTKTAHTPKPTSSHSSADLIRCLSLKPPPITPESQIIATSDSKAVSPSVPSTIIPLHEEGSSSAANHAASPELIENPRSGHQSRDVSPHTSSNGAHLTYILNLNRPSHTNRSLPTQTLPDPQTHSHNGPALEKAVVIHHSSPTLASQGLRGPAVQLSEPLTLSDRMHLAGELPNSSHAPETKAQHLHRFPANLLKNMATLTVSDQCMSNHTYTVNTIQRDTQVNSLIQSCFDPNKDNYKCIDIPEKRNSKPHQNSIFLKVTHHLNYISRLKPQGQVKQQLLQLQGCTDTVNKVRTAPQTPVRETEETQSPVAAVPRLAAPPAPDDPEAGTGDSDERSLCSTSPVRTPTNLRRSPAPAADATADSSFEESTGESSRRRTSASDTPSSPLTWPHSSPGSVPSQSALDAGERELCPHSPTTPSCGVRLQRPWTNLTALAHLRSRVRACPGAGRTLVPRGPEAAPAPAHAHPPDAELRLLPPSPRCSKTAALQWRLETVEASLEANRSRISSLLHIIQDLEHSQVSIAGCWCFRTGQDLQNCSICQRTACVVYR